MPGYRVHARLNDRASCCPSGFTLKGEVHFIRLFRPFGEVLSLECPRESTQREGHPGALIGCRRCPAFLATPGARTTRQVNLPQTGARLYPGVAAVLGECKRVQDR